MTTAAFSPGDQLCDGSDLVRELLANDPGDDTNQGRFVLKTLYLGKRFAAVVVFGSLSRFHIATPEEHELAKQRAAYYLELFARDSEC